MPGFASALALNANEIWVKKHIELCYSLSRYRESHMTTIKANLISCNIAPTDSSSSLMAGFAFVLALDANEIQDEIT